MWLEVVVTDRAGASSLDPGVLEDATNDFCDSSILDDRENPMLPFVVGCRRSDPSLVASSNSSSIASQSRATPPATPRSACAAKICSNPRRARKKSSSKSSTAVPSRGSPRDEKTHRPARPRRKRELPVHVHVRARREARTHHGAPADARRPALLLARARRRTAAERKATRRWLRHGARSHGDGERRKRPSLMRKGSSSLWQGQRPPADCDTSASNGTAGSFSPFTRLTSGLSAHA